jgi:hypothetical protein
MARETEWPMNEPPPLPENLWCSRCGASVQPAANFCYTCGAAVPKSVPTSQGLDNEPSKSRPKNRPVLAMLLLFIFIGFIVYAVSMTTRESAQQPSVSTRPETKPTETKAEYEQRVLAEQQAKDRAASGETDNAATSWLYSEHEDEMGRGTVRLALVTSLNVANFGFPYEGTQHATLKLQKGEGDRPSVWLQMEHANIVNSAPIRARFDGGKPQRFDVVQTTDYKSDRVGIVGEGYSRFMNQLRRAKKLQIEATFFQEGTRVFEFDVHGLEW